ncbi:MAG: UDP-N-acetylglucosamine diphosphorylase/glucosamine-1-phosphate N-acetyltransferase [Betaproteobacteria bacterium RIFCSPLOWO2_02_FULL_65_24]|nr:MAG: UDP-N-acetylglucosamine diphosphorylase/glucosamine-1-phosphate N-acetyltransferase [Betaproteobacteria bacterium RIFCSPLOWO2_02_FULL_65_24]
MNVVILAAGQGKRMHSDQPKVLHALAGRPLLAHVLDTARALAPGRICVVYGHGGEAVRTAHADAGVTWVKQDPQLGTGHALMQALPHLDKNASTLVLYGDVPLTRAETLRALMEAAAQGVAVLTVSLDDPSGYGRIVRGPDGALQRIVEQKDATPEERAIREINTGIMVLPARLLKVWLGKLSCDNAQREYYLTDVVAMAVAGGIPVATTQPALVWETLGVNSRAQLAQLERIHQGNIAQALLEAGVGLADPARIDVRGSLACGRDCHIDVNCVFEGDVVLGDRVVVGAHCVLKNIRVAAGTRIEPFCHLENAEVGERCRIGPYARIRPGTKLGEDVHLGNFVEVKASVIGAGSKANHLSYLGDSDIGRNVNVGAGTITCNYDGVNKHRTVIEDDVFIGSDTQLVAPIRVGRGATLGAGTTLTKDAPADQLTVSRAKQVSVPGWKPPVKEK